MQLLRMQGLSSIILKTDLNTASHGKEKQQIEILIRISKQVYVTTIFWYVNNKKYWMPHSNLHFYIIILIVNK